MQDVRSAQGWTLLTGATGFIGHYLLRELLNRGHRVAVLLRPPVAESLERLCELLRGVGVDGAAGVRQGRLLPLEGDLRDRWPGAPPAPIGLLVHGAASTRFSEALNGEPSRTNVEGTRRLLDWANAARIHNIHLVSSAYVCGRASRPVPERFIPAPPSFHNAYERSKWEAERLCAEWADRTGGCLTIHRPSVVVGEYFSGRSVKFSGFYLLARSIEFLDRVFAEAGPAERQSIPLRIGARGHDCQNIVPVDYVAACMAAIIDTPGRHGRVYHVTHPDPPSNELIKSALESYFGIAGGRFVEPGTLEEAGLNDHERSFYDLSRSIGHYLVDTPTFERDNVREVEAAAGIHCPSHGPTSIHRLVAGAQAAEWGRRRSGSPGEFSPCAAYFEHFLPRYVEGSRVARATAMTTTMRFIIDDEPDGQWVCRFERGRLETVHRGTNGLPADFGYRSTREVFWDAISGRVHPQELFLSGRAEVFGNIESALKMAMILHEFTREYPCTPQALARLEDGA